ncbi:ABC transporter substrate-binding protein [Halococcus hamelinensis]|uniref:Nitrate/sulfonate/bicarbonate ABC transporter periplasmic protein n=1 Tax=Halococcus hamelinensis 100A6 TaxID=1132509 RepID=M0LXU4_9EURY|nr:ABC transporter substrate-binding protein [Halococcus hamelinensis]EMA37983.1 nitrate/sulfonate/bicarbonate ABC transporter periplasmic protein [Halococcus hamelinensis 100A6]
MYERTRRRVLTASGTAALSVMGLSGCVGRSSPSGNDSASSTNNKGETSRAGGGRSGGKLTVAYVPIYPNMQHYIMQEEGYYDSLATEVTAKRFSDGPSVVKAFASDEVDIALFGVTPAMVLTDKSKQADVLAANSRNGFRAMATNAFADLYADREGDAFAAFEKQEGRKVKFGVPPDGSVPDITLRYWIERDLGLGELESVVEKVTVSPAKAPRTMGSGGVDATMIQEPFATVIENERGFGEVAWSGDVLPGHPVTVTFVQNSVPRDVAEGFVEQHSKATQFVRENPAKAAADAAAVIGSGVNADLARRAIDSRASDFLSDPREVRTQSEEMAELVEEVGNTESTVSPKRLFDFGVYDGVSER